jgi:2-polyprenyl-6-methoxyphenol hydroxylase-like FAD-dependent oxidoreductase
MDTAVLVVGAGPTGMMLAAELALAGTDVILVERDDEPSPQSRGGGQRPDGRGAGDARPRRRGPIS